MASRDIFLGGLQPSGNAFFIAALWAMTDEGTRVVRSNVGGVDKETNGVVGVGALGGAFQFRAPREEEESERVHDTCLSLGGSWRRTLRTPDLPCGALEVEGAGHFD